MKYRMILLSVGVLLAGCVNGPFYPWAKCSSPPPLVGCGARPPCAPPPLIGCYGSPCTSYHPSYFYRCHNNRCVTFSPYAPNHCDPVPYYTGCKYTLCCPTYTSYF